MWEGRCLLGVGGLLNLVLRAGDCVCLLASLCLQCLGVSVATGDGPREYTSGPTRSQPPGTGVKRLQQLLVSLVSHIPAIAIVHRKTDHRPVTESPAS